MLKSFKFTDEPTLDPEKKKVIRYVSRALIRIRLEYGGKISTHPITCLIDTGCDSNLFPSSWGKSLGINIENGININYTGIGESSLLAYSHIVKIHIEDTNISFTTKVDFSEKQQTPLLGRSGFFMYFKRIIFDEENGRFTLDF